MTATGRWAAPMHVADDAADAGVGAAERLDRRRVVVRLGLERDGRALAERHDPGVADERRPHERRVDGVGGGAQLVEQRRQRRAVGGRDRGPERLVGAVLAPRLGQRLQLDVGRVAAASASKWSRMTASSAGSRASDRSTPRPARLVGVEAADGDRLDGRRGVVAGVEHRLGDAVPSSAR